MAVLRVRPLETGIISEGFYAVRTRTVNFFVYRTSEGAVCFDSGFGKRRIIEGLKSIGVAPGSITHLFLTHSDMDHAGGVKLFKNANIYLSSEEEEMINGKTPRMGLMHNPRIKRAYNLLRDGEIIDAGGLKVLAIETPGHTPGSMSYLVNDSVLISGDTFRLAEGRACAVRDYINIDTARQKLSIRKLAELENISAAYTAHWGYTKDFSEAIKDWKLN